MLGLPIENGAMVVRLVIAVTAIANSVRLVVSCVGMLSIAKWYAGLN